jgi:hypothetical protein
MRAFNFLGETNVLPGGIVGPMICMTGEPFSYFRADSTGVSSGSSASSAAASGEPS